MSAPKEAVIPIYAVFRGFVAICRGVNFTADRALASEVDMDWLAVGVCFDVEINLEFLCHRLALATAATLPNLAGAL